MLSFKVHSVLLLFSCWVHFFATPCSTPGSPCPPLSPGVCWNSCPLSWCCYLAFSSSATHFSFCLQYFLASRSFPMNHLFLSGGQSIRAFASTTALPVNIQGWFPLGLTGLIPCSPRDSQESSLASQFKSINSLAVSLFYGPTLNIRTWRLEKP